jgi:hypothetical protein
MRWRISGLRGANRRAASATAQGYVVPRIARRPSLMDRLFVSRAILPSPARGQLSTARPKPPNDEGDPAADAAGFFATMRARGASLMPRYDFEVLKGEEVVLRPPRLKLEDDRAAWAMVGVLAQSFRSSGYRIRVRGPNGEILILIGVAAALLHPAISEGQTVIWA